MVILLAGVIFVVHVILFYGIFKKYNYSHQSIFKLGATTYFLTMTFITNLREMLGLSINKVENFNVLVISGFLFLLFFTLLFNDNFFGKTSKFLTNVAVVLDYILLGLVLGDLLHPQDYWIKIVRTGESVDLIIHTALLILVLLVVIIITISVYTAALHQQTILPSYSLRMLRLTIVGTTGGISLTVGTLILYPGLTETISKITVLFGLVLMISSMAMILRSISQNPLTNIYLKSSTNMLLEKNLVNFALFANTDTGPQLLCQSDEFSESTDISSTDLQKFGIQSVALAYNEQGFAQNVSLSPFMGNDEYITLTITFVTHDENLQDERLEKQSFSLFTIFIPEYLIYLFSEPLHEINQLNKVMNDYIVKYPTIDELSDKEVLTPLTIDLLERIF